MKTIKDGIVFSNDIVRILKGNNALDFKYEENGVVLPNEDFFQDIRKGFYEDTNKIFEGNVIILSEDEMLEGINKSILDVYGRYPHCIIR